MTRVYIKILQTSGDTTGGHYQSVSIEAFLNFINLNLYAKKKVCTKEYFHWISKQEVIISSSARNSVDTYGAEGAARTNNFQSVIIRIS